VAAFLVFEVNPSQPPLKKGRSRNRPSLVLNLPLFWQEQRWLGLVLSLFKGVLEGVNG